VFVDDPPEIIPKLRDWTVWSGEEWIERRCRTGRNCIMNPEVVMRSSVQQAIGGYDPKLPHSGDFEMWLRAASVSDVGRVNGPAQGFYRAHAGSMQRTAFAGHAIDLEGRLAAFEKVLGGPGKPAARSEAFYERAKHALAASALECARSAYDHGRAADEPVDAYLAFAARVSPATRQTRKWQSIARSALTDSPHRDRGFGPIGRRLVHDLTWRVRWRRWRRTGV
jgi:hypothetical protein